jgi:hypothetical protein
MIENMAVFVIQLDPIEINVSNKVTTLKFVLF